MKVEKTEVKTLREAAKAGFTLIEIMVAIMIIGMLAAIAVPAVMSNLEDARIEATRSLIKNIEDACNLYNMKHGGKYPHQLSELQEGDDDNPPLLEGEINDPWGNAYVYETRPEGGNPILYSKGPDGRAGTTDDVLPTQEAFDEPFRDTSWTNGWAPYRLRGIVVAPDEETKRRVQEEMKQYD